MALRFHKMHGLGNDFIVVDARAQAIEVASERARALADRRTGVGCDQLILIGPGDADGADVTMRIWNADGGEVAACGNATRCVPMLIGRDVRIRTAAGLLDARLEDGGAAVDMGVPRFEWEMIPLAYAMDTARLPLAWDGHDPTADIPVRAPAQERATLRDVSTRGFRLHGSAGDDNALVLAAPAAVNVGNPHLVFFVADVNLVPLETLGPAIETDPAFPERINVNVATVRARDRVTMRTWERGAGLTRACGTGACAVFACGRRLGLLDRAARVDLPGGTLQLSEGANGHLHMRGPAVHVFSGETEL